MDKIFTTTTDRATFYKKTYANLAIGLVIFAGLIATFLKVEPLVNFMMGIGQGYNWIVVIVGYIGIALLAQTIVLKSKDKLIQYFGFLLFIIVQAMIFIPIIFITIQHSGGSTDLINQAGILTGALFLALTTIVFRTNIDFSFLGSIVLIGLFIAIGVGVSGLLFGFNIGLWYSLAVIVLMSGCILYETHALKNDFNIEDDVPASFTLFSSITVLFMYVLRALSNN